MKRLILISLVFILAACSAGGSELSRNKQTWQDANISHYRFELNLSCFCAFRDQMPLTIEVKDGEVVSVKDASGTAVSTDDPNYQYFVELATIDRLFTELESVTGSADAGEVIVKYDSTLGYPTEASIDYIKEAVDDELYVTVSGLEALP